MQFVAGEVLVDVSGLQDVRVLHRIAVKFIGIVGDEHFFFADQLPIVAVGGTVKHVELVARALTVGGGAGIVVGDVRRAGDASAAGVVNPSAAGLFNLVHGLLREENGAGEASGRNDRLFEHDQGIILFEFGGGHVRERVVENKFILELHELVATAPLDGRLIDLPGGRGPAEAGEVIPEHFETARRDGKRDADDRAADAIAAGGELGGGGVLPRGIVNPLGI